MATHTVPGVDDKGNGASEQELIDAVSDTLVAGIPTYNEEIAIGSIVSRAQQYADEVVGLDGWSSDNMVLIARSVGATVIEQEPQGYGVAVREAILAPDRPVVVTTDCDDTYPMEQLPEFLDLINEGYDVVSGDRLYHGAEAMPAFNRLGNPLFALTASALMGTRVHDTTTGMRAYRREVVESIEWSENTGLSAELLIRPLMRGYDVREHPIEYGQRKGETKLDPIQGGGEIAKSILTVALDERFG